MNDERVMDTRPYPELLSDAEQKTLLARAEQLWRELQADNLGGFSGINRPFWIAAEFKSVIEEFGHRDVGLQWSKNDLDAAKERIAALPTTRTIPADDVEAVKVVLDELCDHEGAEGFSEGTLDRVNALYRRLGVS